MKEITISRRDYRKADEAVRRAVELVRKGYQEKRVIRSIKKYVKGLRIPFSARDAYVAARLRIRGREKFGELSTKLFFDESGYRYSTPSVVADYRAERLKDYSVADVSCGAGMQLCYFGLKCCNATGVELEEKRAYMAALNVMAMESDARVYCGNAFDFRGNADVIFSDPARPESEDVRTLDSLQPDPRKILELPYDLFAFELPPQMPPERVDASFRPRGVKGEKEYTSLNFRLNRLAFYTGVLAECDISAISLPSRERVTSEDERVRVERREELVFDAVAEVDRTITHSGLLENLAGRLGLEAYLLSEEPRRTLLQVREIVPSSFLRYYRVVATPSEGECVRELERAGAGKVTLRFSVRPEEYWKVRKKFEENLKGDKHVYLFRAGERYLICEPV